jgi:hypothetical protein
VPHIDLLLNQILFYILFFYGSEGFGVMSLLESGLRLHIKLNHIKDKPLH